MSDMLALFADELVSVPIAPPRPPEVRVRFQCPKGCPDRFETFPAFLGHLGRHQPVNGGEA